MTSAVPDATVPALVRALAGRGHVEAVWLNDAGGVTYAVTGVDVARYIKWQPDHPDVCLTDEVDRSRWARKYISAPMVLGQGSSVRDGAHWLSTAALPGRSAVDPYWLARPERAVAAVGRGLRALHDALPVARCPWAWAPAGRIERARRAGRVVAEELENAPDVDRLVVCHGDPCCPNTLLDDDGNPTAHVDLASLGVADRRADIAVAARNTKKNFGFGLSEP